MPEVHCVWNRALGRRSLRRWLVLLVMILPPLPAGRVAANDPISDLFAAMADAVGRVGKALEPRNVVMIDGVQNVGGDEQRKHWLRPIFLRELGFVEKLIPMDEPTIEKLYAAAAAEFQSTSESVAPPDHGGKRLEESVRDAILRSLDGIADTSQIAAIEQEYDARFRRSRDANVAILVAAIHRRSHLTPQQIQAVRDGLEAADDPNIRSMMLALAMYQREFVIPLPASVATLLSDDQASLCHDDSQIYSLQQFSSFAGTLDFAMQWQEQPDTPASTRHVRFARAEAALASSTPQSRQRPDPAEADVDIRGPYGSLPDQSEQPADEVDVAPVDVAPVDVAPADVAPADVAPADDIPAQVDSGDRGAVEQTDELDELMQEQAVVQNDLFAQPNEFVFDLNLLNQLLGEQFTSAWGIDLRESLQTMLRIRIAQMRDVAGIDEATSERLELIATLQIDERFRDLEEFKKTIPTTPITMDQYQKIWIEASQRFNSKTFAVFDDGSFFAKAVAKQPWSSSKVWQDHQTTRDRLLRDGLREILLEFLSAKIALTSDQHRRLDSLLDDTLTADAIDTMWFHQIRQFRSIDTDQLNTILVDDETLELSTLLDQYGH